MVWTKKVPQTLWSMIIEGTEGNDHKKGHHGDSIATCLKFMFPSVSQVTASSVPTLENSYNHWVRTLNASGSGDQVCIAPQLGFCVPSVDDPFIVHVTTHSGPRAVCMQRWRESQLLITDDQVTFSVGFQKVYSAVDKATDRSSLVSFHRGPCAAKDCNDVLLDLVV